MNEPEDLQSLATDVLNNYDLIPENIQIIQEGGIKTIWKFDSKNKSYCLKRLRQPLEKAMFSVYAQIYIKSKGGRVADVILNKNSNGITEHNSQLFVVYEWISGRDLNFNDPEDFCLSVQGLAEFHNISKGYNPPDTSSTSSMAGRWLDQYESMKKKLIEWKASASDINAPLSCDIYLKVVDPIIDIANHTINLLKCSPYDKLVLNSREYFVLCHQDYGKGNALLGENGVYVIDLDGVAYDFPVRDIRKIIGKQAEEDLNWNKHLIDRILDCYENGYSLSIEEKNILYIDLMFPHWFFGLVKNIFIKNKDVKASKIQRIADLEMSKVPILNSLL